MAIGLERGNLEVSKPKDITTTELPDDSGNKRYRAELPDDSGVNALDKAPACEGKLGAEEKPSQTEKEASLEKASLTDEQKAQIFKETGWSKEIIDSISTWGEYNIYKNAGLHEARINGRPCLVKAIDMDFVDKKTGKTNRERMREGRPPIDAKTGEVIELHHMGQGPNGPFVELCANSEHGDGNDTILHDKAKESWRRNPDLKSQYNNVERPNHWKARAEEA